MKKVLTLFLTLVMVFSLTACFKKIPTSDLEKQETTKEDTQDYSDTDEDGDDEEDEGWEYEDDEGSFSFTGEWPDNEYTILIPKPDFGAVSFTTITEEEGFTAQVGGGTIEDTKRYIEAVKDKGFTKNDEIFDGTGLEGLETYTYVAENSKGVTVTVTFAIGIFMVEVEL